MALPTSAATGASPPQNVLQTTLWAFRGEKYSSADEFSTAVGQYHAYIKGGFGAGPPNEEARSLWKPNELVIPGYTKLELLWEGLDRDREEMVERITQLESISPKGFTALDLLYQVHNIMVEECRDLDHSFFEGFYYRGSISEDGYVKYEVHQGS